jgi:glutathione S-transferase
VNAAAASVIMRPPPAVGRRSAPPPGAAIEIGEDSDVAALLLALRLLAREPDRLMEAGIEARYRLVDIFTKKIVEDDADFCSVSPKGAVPVLVLEDGVVLTESAAVLQYIADLRPDLGLAPRAGDPERYRLDEWLSFVATEIHKGFLFPSFWYDEAARAGPRQRIGKALSVAAADLEGREYLVGGRFTVADAYLAWALLLVRRCGVELSAWPSLGRYLERIRERPAVEAAIAAEQGVRKRLPQQTRSASS